MQKQLLAGEIDFFIGHYDKSTDHDRISVIHLGTSPAYFMVGENHPLRNKQAVTVEEIGRYPRICGTAWNESLALRIPREMREYLQATIEIDNLSIAKRIVRGSEAILIGYLPTADNGLALINVAVFSLGETSIGLHRLRDRTPSPLASTIVKIVIEYASDHYTDAGIPS